MPESSRIFRCLKGTKFFVFIILCFYLFCACIIIRETELFENFPPNYKGLSSICKRPDQYKTEVLSNRKKISPNSSSSQNASPLGSTTGRGTLLQDLYVKGFSIPNANFCPKKGKNMQVLIAVVSSTDHADRRQAIRRTYGLFARSQQNGIRIAFLVAAPAHPATNDAILREHNRHGDLIQGRFQDTYRNLSLKTVNLLEWVHLHCPKVPFVLKTDDDMFVHVARLLELLEPLQPANRAMLGQPRSGDRPVRDENDPKFYTSREEFEMDVFPDFFMGRGYLMTGNVAKELYEAALPSTFFHLEDVFVSGILAPTLGIQRVPIENFTCESPEECPNSKPVILACRRRLQIGVRATLVTAGGHIGAMLAQPQCSLDVIFFGKCFEYFRTITDRSPGYTQNI